MIQKKKMDFYHVMLRLLFSTCVQSTFLLSLLCQIPNHNVYCFLYNTARKDSSLEPQGVKKQLINNIPTILNLLKVTFFYIWGCIFSKTT